MTKHLPFYALLVAGCAVGAVTNQNVTAEKPRTSPSEAPVKTIAPAVTNAPAPAVAKPVVPAITNAPVSAGTKPMTPAVTNVPAPTVTKPVVKAEPPKPATTDKNLAELMPEEEEVDDIDFNAIDDSAVAAKARPTVKAVSKPADPPAAPRKDVTSGTDVAARYLAQDETALIDITSDDATLADILRQFRKTTGANIIYAASSNLNRRVSVNLTHVPWLEAMTAILGAHGFRVESTGGIHYIREDKLATPLFTRTFQLNHASADELATLFNASYGILDKDGKTVRRIATPFQGANAIVVTAPERILADCEKIVRAVDKAAPQIYIEARFIELSNEALHKLGVQWDQLKSWGATVQDLEGGMSYGNNRGKNRTLTGDRGSTATGTKDSLRNNENSSGFENGASIARNIASLTETSSSSSTRSSNSNQSRKSTSDSTYARAFSGQLSVDDFNLALSAFESMSDVKIFSNPKIIVSNGKEAKVDMTTKFPNVRITATRNTSNGSDSLDISTQLEVIPGEDKLLFAKEAFFSWGITLSVKPRISPDGLISVEIIPQISQLDTSVVMDAEQTPTGFLQVKGGSSSAMSYYPIIEVKRLTTDFTMKDGATAVIGGLSKTTEEDIDSGIPYLREIPWIGPRIFGWKGRGKVQKEIVVFVTVGIADPAELKKDIGLPKNAVMGREFVEGRLLEPGDRPDAAAKISELDMRPVDQRRPKTEKPAEKKPEPEPKGTVTITPVEAAVSPAAPVRRIEMVPGGRPASNPSTVNISPVI